MKKVARRKQFGRATTVAALKLPRLETYPKGGFVELRVLRLVYFLRRPKPDGPLLTEAGMRAEGRGGDTEACEGVQEKTATVHSSR